MKTNTNELNVKELNMNELEQVSGGGACSTAAKKKALRWLVDQIFKLFE